MKTIVIMLLAGLIVSGCVAIRTEVYDYASYDNRSIAITEYIGPGGAVVIPDTINGLPVTSVGGIAFAYCDTLTSITIPNTVTNFGFRLFSYCNNLTNVVLPIGITYIGDYTFEDCTSLRDITIPASVTNIGEGAFLNCKNLTKVCFDGDAPTFGSGGFEGADNATVYYFTKKTGWRSLYAGRPTMKR